MHPTWKRKLDKLGVHVDSFGDSNGPLTKLGDHTLSGL